MDKLLKSSGMYSSFLPTPMSTRSVFDWIKRKKTARRRDAVTHKLTWGIFDIAYDDPSTTKTLFPHHRGVAIQAVALSSLRLLCDLCIIAPRPLLVLVLGSLWMGIAPALSMYLSFIILQSAQLNAFAEYSACEYDRLYLLFLLLAWIGCGVISSLTVYVLAENRLVLSAHLRAHYLPKLAKACLKPEVRYDPTTISSFPGPWGFSDDPAPMFTFIEEFSSKAQDLIGVCLQLFALAHIASVQTKFDTLPLGEFGVIILVVTFLAPSNGVNGAGYTFWTKNAHFHRLNNLYEMIFQMKYRETIAKDGVGNRLYRGLLLQIFSVLRLTKKRKEYKQTSKKLGVVKTDTLSLACNLPPPWYWMVVRAAVIDYPMVFFALTLPWTLSPTSMITMALYQHATTTLSRSIDRLRRFHDPSPTLSQIQRFYETIDGVNAIGTGTVTYPTAASSKEGMKLSFMDVSCAYSGSVTGSKILAVSKVSFNVEPGQLVVIVGSNGCGKTSLLKLLCGLNKISCGDILIDDQPINEYNMNSFRSSMAFLTQSEEIYPISVRENLLMGIPDVVPPLEDVDNYVDEAARLGGAFELIRRLGYDTILDAPPVVGQSMRTLSNGDIGPGALEELKRNSNLCCRTTALSAGEKQRLIASRTFMRIKNSDVKLVVIDEPTSALDPVAERDLFNNFCGLRKGKTMICVTHQFGIITKKADVVLCMKNGQIVQQGTHAELILDESGEYWRLYTAQGDMN